MPDFDLDYLQMERVTLLYVNAVMLLPDDARERGAFLHASLAAALPASPVRDDEQMDLALVKYLLAAPKPEQVLSLRRLKTILYKTEFSGLVLQTVLRAAAHDYRAIASVSAVLRGFATQTARKLETMEEDWQAYSRVSHLWLALDLYLGGDLNRCAADRRLLLRLLAYAEELRKRGEAWVPKRGSTPILDPAHTWKVPAAFELPPVQLSFEPPTPDELKLFGNKRGRENFPPVGVNTVMLPEEPPTLEALEVAPWHYEFSVARHSARRACRSAMCIYSDLRKLENSRADLA